MKLIECVPNFSEGRDLSKIKAITNSIESIDEITLLDVDPGPDTNRTVVTFIGPPEAVEQAIFLGIKTASEVIDMSKHKGTHPRIGATDVCPLIPISNVSDKECIDLSKKIAKRVGDELGIPVFLYEKSSTKNYRKKLPDIRRGEYEGLAKKLNNPKWKPDYGSATFNPFTGATILGVRDFLIAYNINLNTRDHRLATDIAFEIRESGRSKRIPNPKSSNLLDGEIVRNPDGSPVKVKGLFKDVKAVGWYVDIYKRAQISINFNNYKVSSIHDVFDAACELAEKRGVRVTGSELVGLVPEDALLMAGNHYLKKQHRSLGIPKEDIIETAVQSLGLNDVVPFNPSKKIIEYSIINDEKKLSSLRMTEFIDELSRNSVAPGGGSASALVGSLGASLLSMVASLTHEKKDYINIKNEMGDIGLEAQSLKNRLTTLIDEDTNAFNQLIKMNRLPDSTPSESKYKKESIKKANEYAIAVPYEVASLCFCVLEIAKNLVEKGNPNSISDVEVASEAALGGLRGAAMNVLINLKGIDDKIYAKKTVKDIQILIKKAESLHKKIFNKSINTINK
tara:strand:- start:3 stop:1700 length:1698 start_codon:yes stop_codon:yes gene_type:complete